MVPSSWIALILWAGYAVAVALTAAIAGYALTQQAGRVADLFGATMVGLLVWSFAAFGRLIAPTHGVWLALTVLMYAGVAAVPVLLLLFVVDYTNRSGRLTRRRVAALSTLPVATPAMVATNPVHGRFYTAVGVESVAGITVFVAESGPLFLLQAAYGYALLVAATALLLWFAVGSSRVYRQQSLAIAGAVAVPWATNAVYIAGAGPTVPADPTPVGFAVGGVFLAYAVFGAGVTNLSPVARSAVVDAIDDAVFVVGRENELVDLNPAARRLAVFDDPVGEPVSSVVPEPLLSADGEPGAVVVDGTERWFRLRRMSLEPAGAVLLAAELTEEVRRQRQLREQNRHLEQFTRIAAHDLRNPLNAITGYTELARETGDVSHLEEVDPATDRIETLIDDLLTLGREGQVAEDVVPVSLATATERAWRGVDADDAALEVVDDERLLADPSRLRQLLENLFANAVAYGGDDATVRVGTRPDGFFVADDGPGIPADEREQVFEYGYSTHGGTGLGLPVVRSIAVAHGWEVAATEAADGGARFEFTGVRTDPEPFDDLGEADASY